MEVRFAKENELVRINELRKQVNDVHVEGKPDVFKPGFGDELRDFINVIWNDPEQEIVVAVADDVICGFAIIHHINKPENPQVIKTPVVRNGKQSTLGYQPDEWKKWE